MRRGNAGQTAGRENGQLFLGILRSQRRHGRVEQKAVSKITAAAIGSQSRGRTQVGVQRVLGRDGHAFPEGQAIKYGSAGPFPGQGWEPSHNPPHFQKTLVCRQRRTFGSASKRGQGIAGSDCASNSPRLHRDPAGGSAAKKYGSPGF